jgi:PKD repeat protein
LLAHIAKTIIFDSLTNKQLQMNSIHKAIFTTACAALLFSCTKAPVACFVADKGKTAKLNEEVQFDASCAEGGTTYEWNYGDGSALAAGITTKHKFTAAANYTVVLTATTGNKSDTSQLVLAITP